ncbi:MAG: CsbD family protein [Microcoleaceae cyanobacterium]
MEDKINAAAKDAEGKLESAAGEVTGDNQMKAEGELKQVQAGIMNAAEDLKDKALNLVDGLKDAVSDVVENVKEKLD